MKKIALFLLLFTLTACKSHYDVYRECVAKRDEGIITCGDDEKCISKVKENFTICVTKEGRLY
jgi:hypothetical protein